MSGKFFYDTWAFVAIADGNDPHHRQAVDMDRRLEALGYHGVTTDYIFDETLTTLHADGGARPAVGTADSILARAAAGELMLVEVGAQRREAALALFRRIADEEHRLSFTDCTSFAVMRELAGALAFTADRHFFRAGSGIRPLFQRKSGKLVPMPPRE
jgi:predicted nucleic acid-binding protein